MGKLEKKYLVLLQGLLLFEYNNFALKNTVCDFTQRLIIYQKADLLFQKRKLSGASTQAGCIVFL